MKILLLLCCVALCPALEVIEVRWGFGAGPVPDRFNPVSVLVGNSSTEVFEGELVLRRDQLVGGESLVRRCYLAPSTQRWVPFPVYFGADQHDWRLAWRSARESDAVELHAPNFVAPSIALIDDGRLSVSGLPRYPSALFPLDAAWCDGLAVACLDAVPRFDAPQRAAFIDWIAGGGVVVLLQGDDQAWPRFPAAWGPLAAEDGVYGAGRIVRLAGTAREVDLDALVARAELESLKLGDGSGHLDADWFFQMLREQSKPDHNWAIIGLLLVVYILLIGPVAWALGRRRDYRLVNGLVLGSIVVFSLAVGYMGRRGYGEASAHHAVTVARMVAPGRYLVQQWGDQFATIGGVQALRFEQPAAFSSGESYGESGGRVDLDAGAFVVDIPVFSNRCFVAAGTFRGPDIVAQVLDPGVQAAGSHVKISGIGRIQGGWMVRDGVISTVLVTDGNELWAKSQTMSFESFEVEHWSRGDLLREDIARAAVAAGSGVNEALARPWKRASAGRSDPDMLWVWTRDESFVLNEADAGKQMVVYQIPLESEEANDE
ncbi:MAG: hypothetical protein PF961_16135 [Planctomycetota bacterium]|jgi:hypothetical protein|nr:hypothetical protein [Planctomycetota bacterium]